MRGFKIDQDKRWGLIYQLSRFNYSKSLQLIKTEGKKDKSSSGVKMVMVSKAAIPNWDSKLVFLNKMTSKDSKLTYDQFSSLARSLFPSGQEEFRQKYKNDFFTQLLKIEKSKESHYPKAFTRLSPDECSFDAGSVESFLKANTLKAGTSKRLKIAISESKRCKKIKELAKAHSLKN